MASTYGETMRPLDLNALELEPAHRIDTDVIRFIELADRNSRAEKVSNPDDWTPAERAAYDSGDWKLFSRLRGYSESEIADFGEWLQLVAILDLRYGSDYSVSLSYAIDRLSGRH